jgi:hypothetical protein
MSHKPRPHTTTGKRDVEQAKRRKAEAKRQRRAEKHPKPPEPPEHAPK